MRRVLLLLAPRAGSAKPSRAGAVGVPLHPARPASRLALRATRPSPQGGGKGAVALLLVWLLVLASPAFAQTFPPLTGRVVDAANLLTAEQRSALEAKLKAHEDRSTDQVVVATVASLGGVPIEDYANRLYRAWGLGTKAKSNGALFLVAPNDRKVRIEVGYGLEGALTDAITSVVIRSAVTPRFKAGDFAGGIGAGTDAILGVLEGDADEWGRRAKVRNDEGFDIVISPLTAVLIVIALIVVIHLIRRAMSSAGGPGRPHRRRGGSWIAAPTSGSGWSGGFGGGSSGGGFSGGGGSSGGGGASGSW